MCIEADFHSCYIPLITNFGSVTIIHCVKTILNCETITIKLILSYTNTLLKKKWPQIKKRPKTDLFDQKGLLNDQGLLKKTHFDTLPVKPCEGAPRGSFVVEYIFDKLIVWVPW